MTRPSVSSKTCSFSPEKLMAAQTEFDEMLSQGTIRPFKTERVSPIHMVPKATLSEGDWRRCGVSSYQDHHRPADYAGAASTRRSNTKTAHKHSRLYNSFLSPLLLVNHRTRLLSYLSWLTWKRYSAFTLKAFIKHITSFRNIYILHV